MNRKPSHILGAAVGPLPVAVLLLICCLLPLVWMVHIIWTHPASWLDGWGGLWGIRLAGRTAGYNLLVALVAGVLGLAGGIGATRGGRAGAAAMLLWPLTLLLPSLCFDYGWNQLWRLSHLRPRPQSAADVLRCAWTLGTWLWPLCALATRWALVRTPNDLWQQARLDGAAGRLAVRRLARPLLAGMALAALLAAQEFGVWEATGISVSATEVRTVFEMGGGEAASLTAPRDRYAAALGAAMPMMVLSVLLAALAAWGLGEHDSADDWLTAAPSRPGRQTGMAILAWSVPLLTAGVPLGAMMLSMRTPLPLGELLRVLGPQLLGSLLLGAIMGLLAGAVALFAMAHRPRWTLAMAVASFLAGGPPLAIALMHLYNRAGLQWVYDTLVIAILALVGRFAWLGLLMGGWTWNRSWLPIRQMAALDGADRRRTLWHVILPQAWPLAAAAALTTMALSLGEVPATMLLAPQNPPLLTPLLMTWAHNQRYDPMLQGSLLLAVATLLPAAGGICILTKVINRNR